MDFIGQHEAMKIMREKIFLPEVFTLRCAERDITDAWHREIASRLAKEWQVTAYSTCFDVRVHDVIHYVMMVKAAK